MLQELQTTVQQVASTVAPSVVGIGKGWGQGSGVVVADGQVLTNAHNVRGGEVTITFADGHAAAGTVGGVDIDGDLAVIAVDTAGTQPIRWESESGALGVGAPVFAVANPGGRGIKVTFGTVSALGRAFRGPRGRRVTGSVEHTAPLARGSSGSPIIDAQGRFAALNTNRLGDGFYLAIPAGPELRSRVEALGRGESAMRPSLGVGVAPSRAAQQLRRAVGLPDRDGLLVRVVEDDSPAGRAAIRPGDLLVEADGRPVTTADELYEVLDGVGPGGTLRLRVVRGVDELDVSVAFTGGTGEEGSA